MKTPTSPITTPDGQRFRYEDGVGWMRERVPPFSVVPLSGGAVASCLGLLWDAGILGIGLALALTCSVALYGTVRLNLRVHCYVQDRHDCSKPNFVDRFVRRQMLSGDDLENADRLDI